MRHRLSGRSERRYVALDEDGSAEEFMAINAAVLMDVDFAATLLGVAESQVDLSLIP